MKTTCPQCAKQLKLNAKFEESLAQLQPGQVLRVKCPQCAHILALDATLLDGAPAAEDAGGAPKSPPASGGQKGVKPPDPPDTRWLWSEDVEDREVVEEVPMALLLMPEMKKGRKEIIEAIEDIGYRVEMAKSAEEAIEKIQFVNYASVILHTSFEEDCLARGRFHQFFRMMEMARRRFIFYVLVGPEFKTCYDLQALAYSANVVVNDNEIPRLSVVLHKAIPEYEELFGPIMEEMRIQGK